MSYNGRRYVNGNKKRPRPGSWSSVTADSTLNSMATLERSRFAGRKSYKKGIGKKGTMRALIRKTIISMAETKTQSYSTTSTIQSADQSSTVGVTWIQVTPSSAQLTIAQGSGQGDRVGNKVRVKKAGIRMAIYPQQYNVTTNTVPQPYDIRIVVAKNKNNPVGNVPAQATLFQSGDTVVAATGAMVDLNLPFNKDLVTVYSDRRFKLAPAISPDGVAGNTAKYAFSNNDYSLNILRNVDVTKYVPAEIEWNDTTATPVSDSVWIGFILVRATGVTGDAAADQSIPATVNWTLNYEYTDM